MADEEQTQKQEYKYWAFISYSHSDEEWARWLHRGLETYAVPAKLIGKIGRDGAPVPRRAAPVFRDRDELPGSAKLTDNIEWALGQSRYLIVICSPNAVASQWVDQEIRIYKSMGREDRVLCLIVDGEPNVTHKPEAASRECFPEAIRFWVDANRRTTGIPTEPIAADARKGKDGKTNAMLKLLAGILGVAYDDLRQREQARRAVKMRWLAVGAIVALIVLSYVSMEFYLQRNTAIESQHYAEAQKHNAEQARDEAKQSLVLEKAAKEAAEKARKEAVEAAEQERLAKEKEAAAHQQAEAARQVAVAAQNEAIISRNEAVASEKKVRRILSTSDLTAATRLIDETNQAKALAYLSRALRFDPDNVAVVSRVISLLSERNWALPAEPLPHNDEVKQVEFSPDNKTLLTVSGNSAKIWDASTEQLLFELAHDQAVTFAAFSPDGKLVLTAGRDDVAQLWDAATGKKSGAPLQHSSGVSAAAFSPDGKLIATGALDRSTTIWDVATGQKKGHPILSQTAVHSLSFHPLNNWLLVVSKNTAQVWDVATQDPVGAPMTHEGGIAAAVFSPSGKYVATASGDKTARLWDAATGQPTADPLQHGNWVNSVEFSPDEIWLATSCSDGTARVWEVPRGKAVGTFHHEGEVLSARFSPNARWLVTASADNTAMVWDVLSGQSIMEPLKHTGPVYDAVFSDDGRSVATASGDHKAKVWNIVSGKPVFEPMRHSQSVLTAIFSPDGKWVATGSADRSARVWEVGSGRPITESLPHEAPVIALLFTADGKRLITGSEDGAARIWDIETRQQVCPPLHHLGWVNSISLSPDGQWLATASEDRTARIWNANTGAPVTDSLQHLGPVKSAVFSADGKWLLTASIEKSAHLWEAATGKPGATLRGHDNSELRCAALSPDGQWVAGGFADHTVVLWNAATGEIMGSPLAHEAAVTQVDFAPGASGRLLTVADKFARVWDAATGKALTEPIRHEERIRAAHFSADGNFFVTICGKTARVWESASGRPVSDPLTHSSEIKDANFSPSGNLLVTCSADQTARVWFLTVPGTAPGWLSDLADAIGGYRLDESGATQLIPEPWRKLSQTRLFLLQAPPDPYVTWGQWFALGDRSTRSMWAFGDKPVNDYVLKRVTEGTEDSLSEALQIMPNSGPALARLGLNATYPAQADFFTKLAQTYDPQDPDVLLTRATILEEQNQPEPALALMQRALSLDPQNIRTFGPDGTDFAIDNRDGILAKGWLPKGWLDQSTASPVSVTYSKLDDVPVPGTVAIEMKVSTQGANFAQLCGPHLAAPKNGRCTIEGWARSAIKSELNMTLMQLVEPHKNYFAQIVHTTPEWKPFKIQWTAPQNLAAELVIRATGGTDVQFAGVILHAE